MMYINC